MGIGFGSVDGTGWGGGYEGRGARFQIEARVEASRADAPLLHTKLLTSKGISMVQDTVTLGLEVRHKVCTNLNIMILLIVASGNRVSFKEAAGIRLTTGSDLRRQQNYVLSLCVLLNT